MGIMDWPAHERPREKLIAQGPQALSEAELLAILLRSGSATRNVVDIARHALATAGGLTQLAQYSKPRFCELPGLGEAGFAQVQAALELARRQSLQSFERGDALSSPARVRRFLSLQLGGVEHEVFAALFLDNRHRVICFDELFRGTIDGAAVYPREVLKRCLSANAAAVIFAHNHPSGIAEPSDADVSITRKLIDALALIDVRVLDHLIIGQGVQTSLAERGLM